MISNQYEERGHTSSFSNEHAPYHYETALQNSEVTLDTEIESLGEYVSLEKSGRSMVTFFRWRMSRIKRLCIIICLILFLVFIALLPIVFAFTTAIIKHNMNKVVLSINSMDVTTISNDSILDVTFSVNLQHNVLLSIAIDEMTASLVYRGNKVGKLKMGALTFKSGSQNYNLTIPTKLIVSNINDFSAFAEAIIQDTTVPFTIKAEIDAIAMGLPFNNLNFERTLSVIGFNKFQHMESKVEQIGLSGCTNDGYEMDVHTSVNNPSAIGLQGIGTLNMSIYANNSYLGYAYSELGLPRGQSSQKIHVVMPEKTPAVQAMITGLINGGYEVNIRGDNPYATEHIPFKDALDTVDMTITALSQVFLNTSCKSIFLGAMDPPRTVNVV